MDSRNMPFRPVPKPAMRPAGSPAVSAVIFSVVLTAAATGGIFLWQRAEKEKFRGDLERQIKILGYKVTEAEALRSQDDNAKAELRERIAELESEVKGLEARVNAAEAAKTEAERQKTELERRNCRGVWKDGICVLRACEDSDAGEKPDDIFVKGKVIYTDDGGTATTTYDSCAAAKDQVNELRCVESPAGSGNYLMDQAVYDCPAGCLNGACVRR